MGDAASLKQIEAYFLITLISDLKSVFSNSCAYDVKTFGNNLLMHRLLAKVRFGSNYAALNGLTSS